MGLDDNGKLKRQNFFINNNINITTTADNQDYVFISYKSDDWEKVFGDIVLKLHHDYGLRFYCDKEFENSNDIWLTQMQEHMNSSNCKAIICFISRKYFCSYATLLELMQNRLNESVIRFKGTGTSSMLKPVIPIILDDVSDLNDKFYHDYAYGSSTNGFDTGLAGSGDERRLFNELLDRLDNVKFDDVLNKEHQDYKKITQNPGVGEPIMSGFTYRYIKLMLTLSNANNFNEYKLLMIDIKPLVKTIKSATKDFNTNISNVWGDVGTKPLVSNDFDIQGGVLVNYSGSDEYIVIPNSVTSIGEFAFQSCSSIKEVIIPNSVFTIGKCAFQICSNLTQVQFPDTITSIGDLAFFACDNLTQVVIPNSAAIGVSAFSDKTNVIRGNIPAPVVTQTPDTAPEPAPTTEQNASQISDFDIQGGVLVKYSGSDEYIVIPNSVTSIGEFAFSNCSSIREVVIPNSVVNIDYGAFEMCSNLCEMVIPDSVTTLAGYVFWECKGLSKVILSNSVSVIDKNVFYECSSLNEITIPNSVTTIGEQAFYGCSSLKEVIIPDSVTTIDKQAFYGCSSLKEVTIPNSVNIDKYAFKITKVIRGNI